MKAFLFFAREVVEPSSRLSSRNEVSISQRRK